MDMDLILQGAVRASRSAAIITGVLVTIDSCAVLLDQTPRPPRPRVSAAAWLVAGLVVATVGSLLVSKGVLLAADLGREFGAKVAVGFWGGLACAFTVRAVARAERPLLTFASFLGVMAFGTALAVTCPL